MERRTLAALIFELSPRPGGTAAVGDLVVWNPPHPDTCMRPDPPKPWSRVEAGDELIDADGERRTVLRVRIFRGHPAADVGYDRQSIGRVVTSGRAWLAGADSPDSL